MSRTAFGASMAMTAYGGLNGHLGHLAQLRPQSLRRTQMPEIIRIALVMRGKCGLIHGNLVLCTFVGGVCLGELAVVEAGLEEFVDAEVGELDAPVAVDETVQLQTTATTHFLP